MPRIFADNLAVDYEDSGTGVPVVFIPGLTEHKEAFSFQLRGLHDRYRIISYDVRRGLKKPSDYTLELLVEDLRKFLAALGLNSAVICGHSFGGIVAMQCAAQYPEMTRALILVSSFPSAPEISADRFTGWMSSAGHPSHASIGAILKVHMSKLLGTKASSSLEHQVAALRSIAHQAEGVAHATVHQRMRIVQKADFGAVLPDIVAPTLVVAGAKDRPFFLSSAQKLYENIPNATLDVIENSGHFCFMTHHDRFNAAVDDFLTAYLGKI